MTKFVFDQQKKKKILGTSDFHRICGKRFLDRIVKHKKKKKKEREEKKEKKKESF